MSIVVAIMFLLGLLFLSKTKKSASTPVADSCPPHEWTTVQQLGEHGEVVDEYLKCKKCGPLNGIGNTYE